MRYYYAKSESSMSFNGRSSPFETALSVFFSYLNITKSPMVIPFYDFDLH